MTGSRPRRRAEKGFSLGFFDEAYIACIPGRRHRARRTDSGLREHLGRAPAVELSVDLMRYHRDAPKDVMEALFVHMMQLGQGAGVPVVRAGHGAAVRLRDLAGRAAVEPPGAFLYEHGEAVYNFQGLRAYKEKFNPVWEPHYLAYPGGLRLPRIIADVSALVAGGYRRIFRK